MAIVSTFRLKPAVLACALLCAGAAAQAQTKLASAEPTAESSQPETAAPQDALHTLPVVKVTGSRSPAGDKLGPTRSATGLSLSQRDTPQAMSVITRERIEAGGLATLNALLGVTPGLSVTPRDSGRSTIVARGFEVSNYRLDGLPVPDNDVYLERLATAAFERVEITRGATGLMAGEGDPSASVSMVRKRASAKTLQGQAKLELGTQARRSGTLDVAGGLNADGSLRGRVVLHDARLDGLMDRERHHTRQALWTLEADLTPRTLLTLGHLYNRSAITGGTWGFLPVFYSDGSLTQFPRKAGTSLHSNRWIETINTSYLKLEHRFDSKWQLQTELSRNAWAGDYQMMWPDGEVDRVTGLGLTGTPYLYNTAQRGYTATLMLNGPVTAFGRRHELNLGLQHVVAPEGWRNRDLLDAAPVLDSLHHWTGVWTMPALGEEYDGGPSRITQTAAFAAARVQLTDTAKLIVGARWSDYRNKQEVGQWNPEAHEVRHKNVLTPYGGVVWDLSDSVSAYVSHAGIFKHQRAKDKDGQYLAPLDGVSQELGLKGEWMQGALQGSATLFKVAQNNFPVPDKGAAPLANGDLPQRGVRGVSSRGFELELNGQATRDWRVGVSFSHFKVSHPLGETVLSEVPRTLFKLNSQLALSGWAQGWHLGADLNWQGADAHETPNPKTNVKQRTGQDAFALLGLMLRWDVNKQLSAQLNVDNVLDKHYRQMSSWGGHYTAGAPRSVKLGLDLRF